MDVLFWKLKIGMKLKQEHYCFAHKTVTAFELLVEKLFLANSS